MLENSENHQKDLSGSNSRSEGKANLASAMLYEHRLNRLGKAFASNGLAPVVVKGQAIVDLAMMDGDIRLSDDVDFLVDDDNCKQTVATLISLGYKEQEPYSRHYHQTERTFLNVDPELPPYVEVHTSLDKIIRRNVRYHEILVRARESGRQGIRYPCIEDLLLLVVLHASADMFFDGLRINRDLKNLIEHGKPDLKIVRVRAREWGLSKALDRFLSGNYSRQVHQRETPSRTQVVRYFLGQFAWHDKVTTVIKGISSYAVARILDKVSQTAKS